MKATSNKFFLSTIALLALLGISIWIFSNVDIPNTTTIPEETGGQSLQTAQKPFVKLAVQEPFQNLATPQEAVVIENPAQATVLQLTSGSTIEVPAHAFVDEQGKPVTVPVTIEFKEFHDAADIIASGIPMRVRQPHGDAEWMQTAGMFTITGFASNRTVRIAEGKQLNVSLLSNVDGAYDFWYFNEAQGNWENLMPGVTPENTSANVNQDKLEEEIRQLKRATATLPEAPVYDVKNNLTFPDLDLKRCPELQKMTPLVLNYAGKDEKLAPKNNKWISKPGIWTKKRLECSNEPDIFTLTLIGDTIYQIPVRIALQPADLERAKAEYEAKLAEFKANQQLLREKESIIKQQAFFRRSMEIENFGIHNYDILWKVKDAVPLLADFDFGAYPEDMKDLITVYLITGDGRTIISLPKYDWNKFSFSPSSDNKMVAVLPGNKIALFTQSDFKSQMNDLKKAAGRAYTFKMRIENQEVNSISDLNKWIKKASS